MKTLDKSNIAIAEFMGVESKVYSDTPSIIYYNFTNSMLTPDKMKYNTSWDWLMPVIEKISKMYLPDPDNASEDWQPFPRTFGMINEDNGYFMFRFNRHCIFQAPTLIEAAFFAVSDFIETNNKAKS